MDYRWITGGGRRTRLVGVDEDGGPAAVVWARHVREELLLDRDLLTKICRQRSVDTSSSGKLWTDRQGSGGGGNVHMGRKGRYVWRTGQWTLDIDDMRHELWIVLDTEPERTMSCYY